MATEIRDFPLQTRAAPVAGFNEADRTVDVVWSTGAKVRRWDWMRERYYDESLSLDPAHVRMGRLASGRAPVLDSHNSYRGLSGVLGVVQRAALDPAAAPATLRFSKRAEAASVMEDVRDQIITNVSVGYSVFRYEMVPPAQSGDVWEYRAVDWEPHEISFVPIGADADAGTRGQGGKPDARTRTFACEFINTAESSANTQEKRMYRSFIAPLGVKVDEGADDAAVRSALVAHLGLKDEASDDEIVSAACKRSAAPDPAPAASAEPASASDPVVAERARVAELVTLCAQHRASPDFQAKAVSEGWSKERAALEILNERAAKGEPGPQITAHGEPETRSGGAWDHTIKKFGGQ